MRTKQSFTVKHIFFATVPHHDPEKGYRNRNLKYKVISTGGATTDYLFDIFDKASDDCKVEILFKSDQQQNNPIRSLLLDFASTNVLAEKEKIFTSLAKKMYDITDLRNGMGLFVLIEGQKNKQTRLMLCRFKGADGLHNEGDKLEYLKQVFTKKNNHYKLAVYQDIVSKKSFWKGFAIDRQTAAQNYRPFSNFWIEGFLQSETAITDAQGTDQFSSILKNVLNKTTDITEKEQIISAVINLKSKVGANVSVKSFADSYLTPALASRFKEETNNEIFYESVFGIDSEVFQKELGSTVLVLEDGVTAYVPTFAYKKHVTETQIQKGAKKIVIEGVLRDKRINVEKERKVLKKRILKKKKSTKQ